MDSYCDGSSTSIFFHVVVEVAGFDYERFMIVLSYVPYLFRVLWV